MYNLEDVNGFFIMKPVGGRGIKAPYEQTHMRVPLPIKPQIETLINNYRENLLTSNSPDTIEKSLTSLEEAIEEAKKILRAKKSARESMARLLTAIYGSVVTLDDLSV